MLSGNQSISQILISAKLTMADVMTKQTAQVTQVVIVVLVLTDTQGMVLIAKILMNAQTRR
jgi:hypothetical protein